MFYIKIDFIQYHITYYNINMNSENRMVLFQRAGEIIIDRYKNIKDIPEKYLLFYKNYIPPSVGVKRKFDESNL